MKKWIIITACLFGTGSMAVAQSAPKAGKKTTEPTVSKGKESSSKVKDSASTASIKLPAIRIEADTANNPQVRVKKD